MLNKTLVSRETSIAIQNYLEKLWIDKTELSYESNIQN